MRALAITQNTTLDGSIEMLGDWFDPQAQADTDDLTEEMHRQDSQADALLVGRQTFEDLRGYWPAQTDDRTGVTAYPEPGAEVCGLVDAGRPGVAEHHRADR